MDFARANGTWHRAIAIVCGSGADCRRGANQDILFHMDRIFILTAELDPANFTWLNALRCEHFPQDRNVLPAHLTLFHRLSSAQTARLDDLAIPTTPIPVLYDGVRLLGFGVAIKVQAPELERLRTALRDVMGEGFSRQDSQAWRPHVTIQNKVTAAAARRLFEQLQIGFAPRAGAALGLLVWEYLNGPWRLDRRIPFDTSAASVPCTQTLG